MEHYTHMIVPYVSKSTRRILANLSKWSRENVCSNDNDILEYFSQQYSNMSIQQIVCKLVETDDFINLHKLVVEYCGELDVNWKDIRLNCEISKDMKLYLLTKLDALYEFPEKILDDDLKYIHLASEKNNVEKHHLIKTNRSSLKKLLLKTFSNDSIVFGLFPDDDIFVDLGFQINLDYFDFYNNIIEGLLERQDPLIFIINDL